MRYLDETIHSYLDAVDAKTPTPGGGSVSALVGAAGVALGRMVGQLTVERKHFRSLDEPIRSAYRTNIELLKQVKKSLMDCVEEDAEAFSSLMAAFKLPDRTDEEIKIRKEALNKASERVLYVPLKTANLSLKALTLIHEMAPYSHPHLLSDIGISAIHLVSAIDASIINIKTNLKCLHPVENAEHYQLKVKDLQSRSDTLKAEILAYVELELNDH